MATIFDINNLSSLNYYIHQHYGPNIIKLIKNFNVINKKIIMVSAKLKFLLTCKRNNILPNFLKKINFQHISFFNSHLSHKFNEINNNFLMNSLSLLIKDCFIQINHLKHKLNHLKNILETTLPNNIIIKLLSIKSTSNFKLNQRILICHNNKLKKLLKSNDLKLNNNNHNINNHQNNTWIINLSNTIIPTSVIQVIKYGPKFNLPPINFKDIPTENLISNLETGIKNLEPSIKTKIRSNICNIITNFKNHSKRTTFNSKSNISLNFSNNNIPFSHTDFINTKKFLKLHNEIIITSADKTQKTVIMNTQSYNDKMTLLLSDTNTYKKISKNPTLSIQNKNNSIVKDWHIKNFIDLFTYKKLICHNGLPSKIYGLPKLHKLNFPLRPIVSTYTSPIYLLSKFLSQIITNVVKQNKSCIKDSWSFKKLIDKIKIPSNYKIYSFDIVSMYTNIPLELVTKSLINNWNKIKSFTNIPKNDFINAVTFVLNSTYFTFNKQFFSQIQGLAMGQPISSTIADLVIGDLEQTLIKNYPYIHTYFRYVDDIFIIAHMNHIQQLFNKFNNYHPLLKFTLEEENNFKINFLDLTIYHLNNGNIKTNWYRKSVKTDRYINYNSCTPIKYKKSVIFGLVDRAIILSSNIFHQQNLNIIKNILLHNNYPSDFINKCIHLRLKNIQFSNPQKKIFDIDELQPNCLGDIFNNIINNKKKLICLPYIPKLSENLTKSLSNFNITIAFKNTNNLHFLIFSKLKDKIDFLLNSNIIYQINCNNCPSVYIGQSKQYLKDRIYQHKNSIKKCLSSPLFPNTALTDHAIHSFHNFDFINPIILHKEINYNNRLILEMIEIKKNNNSINYRTDILNLSNIYFNLFK